MSVAAKKNLLAVDVKIGPEVFENMPIRVVRMNNGKDSVGAIKSLNVTAIISRWNLADMSDGELLKKLKSFKPDMIIIAIIETEAEEIAARRLGVSAVMSNDCDDKYLQKFVCELLGLDKKLQRGVSAPSWEITLKDSEKSVKKIY